MKPRSGWSAARGQIAWILALIVSTGIVIQLERLDLGLRLAQLETGSLTKVEPPWSLTLRAARAAAPDPGQASQSEQLALVLALAMAGLHSDADPEALATEARAVINALGPDALQNAMVRDGVNLLKRIIGV